ncbi:hypothetical protein STENM223S_02639 [Streptomyces tendae]
MSLVYFMSRYVRSAGERISPVPFLAASATWAFSAALVRSRPQYWTSAPSAGPAPASWCQPTTVLPYLATIGCTRCMNVT